jgi:hypothetical protein
MYKSAEYILKQFYIYYNKYDDNSTVFISFLDDELEKLIEELTKQYGNGELLFGYDHEYTIKNNHEDERLDDTTFDYGDEIRDNNYWMIDISMYQYDSECLSITLIKLEELLLYNGYTLSKFCNNSAKSVSENQLKNHPNMPCINYDTSDDDDD